MTTRTPTERPQPPALAAEQAELRRQLARGLAGQDSHMPFEEAVADFPEWAINDFAANVEYTPWHLVEHLRRTQRDILDYIRNADYRPRAWPADYWPDRAAQATPAEFAASVDAFLADRQALAELVADPTTDLLAPLPHAPRHTIAREARIVANHNSYHVGEFAIMRQFMGSWGPSH